MAPQVGLEPTTLRLTAGCSAIELLRSIASAGALSLNCPHHCNETRRFRQNRALTRAHRRDIARGLGLMCYCRPRFGCAASSILRLQHNQKSHPCEWPSKTTARKLFPAVHLHARRVRSNPHPVERTAHEEHRNQEERNRKKPTQAGMVGAQCDRQLHR